MLLLNLFKAPFTGPDEPLRVHAPLVRLFVVIQAMITLCAVAALVISLTVFSDRVDTVTEHATFNKILITEVQASRVDLLRTGCIDQNKRNWATIAALKKLHSAPNPFIKQFSLMLATLNRLAATTKVNTADLRQGRDDIRIWNHLYAMQQKQAIDGTINLINALAPVRDCDQVVKSITNLPPSH